MPKTRRYKIVDHVRATLVVEATSPDAAYRKADRVPVEQWDELEVTSSELIELDDEEA